MESHEIIKKAFEESASPKEIAAEMGVSLSLVYKWAQPNTDMGSGSRNPLDRALELYRLTEDPHIVQWLCEEAGGYFVRNPKSYCEEGFEVLPATNEIVTQFSELLSTISRAAADNVITDDESAGIRDVWEELKCYCEGFVNCCEEGDFSPMNVAKKAEDADEDSKKTS